MVIDRPARDFRFVCLGAHKTVSIKVLLALDHLVNICQTGTVPIWKLYGPPPFHSPIATRLFEDEPKMARKGGY